MLHLAQDEFSSALTALAEGIECNRQNAPLNHDMQMLMNEIRAKMASDIEADVEPHSVAHLLLRQAALKATKH